MKSYILKVCIQFKFSKFKTLCLHKVSRYFWNIQISAYFKGSSIIPSIQTVYNKLVVP